MENYTYNSYTLQLEGLIVSEESTYTVFLFFFFSYLFIIIANFGIIVLVFIDKSLHQPMYLLFCNLTFNDVLGNSILVPRLMMDLLRPPSERLISYYECVVQAFISHMFATSSLTVLMIMAFDRYVAICDPLRYAAIMTNQMVMKLTVSAWGVALVMVGILLGLTIRLNRCRTLITNPYCDNASLFKLSCEDVSINNIYGLVFTVVLFSGSIGSTVLTYTKIAVVCGTSKNKSLNSKALKTCSTHLTVYLLMLVSGLANIVLHRFPQYTPYRKLSVILFHIIPGSLNPLIYGLQSKEIRTFLSSFNFKKASSKPDIPPPSPGSSEASTQLDQPGPPQLAPFDVKEHQLFIPSYVDQSQIQCCQRHFGI
ncbi:olfactory receptor 146-like [Etheostoma cragini]|uniref:olfactory receptor 146-like n=1 Tax=Etheostoma cragini TaxID=417921 RepID=UPI00155E0F84|nr:olfactory receptor 146-like [Etheostoma cragini]